jgi:hypothetical protein
MGNSTPVFMDPARAGDLMQTIMMKTAQPPALAPMPLLTDSDVAEPPLPPARSNSSTSPTHSGATRMHAHATHILVLVILPMLFAWCSLVWACDASHVRRSNWTPHQSSTNQIFFTTCSRLGSECIWHFSELSMVHADVSVHICVMGNILSLLLKALGKVRAMV